MKFKSLLLGLLFVIGISTATAEEQGIALNTETSAPNDDIITYTVKKGDTVYSIAAAHNTTVEEIYRQNPEARNGIKKGTKLKIAKVIYKPVGYSDHLIEAKETLFSVSRMYNITVDNLKNANPGLDESNFKTGKTIRIPKYSVATINTTPAVVAPRENNTSSEYQHKVEKGETLYSISKKYNTTVESILLENPSVKDGLKEGMLLKVLGNDKSTTTAIANNREVKETPLPLPTIETVRKQDNTVRIAILLPFLDEKNSMKDKMIEYYQGFLLGVKELKEKGYNAEIYTFDIGTDNDTKKLESLLGTTEMNNLDLMIGGVSNQQIDVISRFSKKTGIRYVIPFGTKSSAVTSNPFAMQATTPPSSLLDKVASTFKNQFKNHNIIFVSEKGSDNNKKDFVSDLKKVLAKANISHQTIGSSDNLTGELKEAIKPDARNLLVPTSSSEATLNRLFAHLQMSENPEVSLFGYPEWQTYTNLYNQYYKNDTYLYSIFYLDESQYKVRSVKDQYIQWYNKPIINSFPRFAYLGYDAAIYFMTAIHQYGANFDTEISKVNIPTLQSAANFERSNEKSGYINSGIYLVHFKSDNTIEKIECNK